MSDVYLHVLRQKYLAKKSYRRFIQTKAAVIPDISVPGSEPVPEVEFTLPTYPRSVGHDPIWFLELHGAAIIEPTAFEPDPSTHRGTHYYNAITNTLHKKIITRKEPGIVVAHWQKVSD